MGKRALTTLMAALMVAIMAVPALAASFSGKVAANDGEKVTLAVDKGVPAWVKKGGTVKAIGGMPTVMEVKDNEVVLRFSKAKAAKLKVNASLTVNENKGGGGEQLQGC